MLASPLSACGLITLQPLLMIISPYSMHAGGLADAHPSRLRAGQHAEHGGDDPASRWLSAAGNALFAAALGGGAYFGYYTLRYSTPEMEQLVAERRQPEHAFPSSEVTASFLQEAERSRRCSLS